MIPPPVRLCRRHNDSLYKMTAARSESGLIQSLRNRVDGSAHEQVVE